MYFNILLLERNILLGSVTQDFLQLWIGLNISILLIEEIKHQHLLFCIVYTNMMSDGLILLPFPHYFYRQHGDAENWANFRIKFFSEQISSFSSFYFTFNETGLKTNNTVLKYCCHYNLLPRSGSRANQLFKL